MTEERVHGPTRSYARGPAFVGYMLMRVGLSAIAVVLGADKFFDWMTRWKQYVWRGVPDFFGVSTRQLLYAAGVALIVGGVLTLLLPRIGSIVLAVYFGLSIANLVILGYTQDRFWEIALLEFGLFIGALALHFLAWDYRRARRVGEGRARDVREVREPEASR